MQEPIDRRAWRCWATLVVCALIASQASLTAFAQQDLRFADGNVPNTPTPPVFDHSATQQEPSKSWFAVPTVHVQLSTPSAYLRGWRDDYTSTSHAAYYSEYTFTMFSDADQRLRLNSDATTDAAAKPFLEDQGMQVYLSHELPLQRLAKEAFDIDADMGQAELTYGVRYQSNYSGSPFSATSWILGEIESETHATNHFLGPQVALNWTQQKYGCTLNINSKLMVGQNSLHANQWNTIGSGLTSGGLNSAVFAQPNTFTTSLEHEVNTTVAELRTSVSYPLLKDLNLRAGYIGVYFADMHRARDMQSWTLPAFSLDPSQGSELWSDQIYASIEWRR